MVGCMQCPQATGVRFLPSSSTIASAIAGSWTSLTAGICSSLLDVALAGSFGVIFGFPGSASTLGFRSCVSLRLDQSLRGRLVHSSVRNFRVSRLTCDLLLLFVNQNLNHVDCGSVGEFARWDQDPFPWRSCSTSPSLFVFSRVLCFSPG